MTGALLTVKEAAAALGIHVRVVDYHIRRGNLPATKLGPIWVIPRRAVTQMIASRQGAKPGPKPKHISFVTPAEPSLPPASTGQARSADGPVGKNADTRTRIVP